MIVPVLPVFFQMAISTQITDPLESIMWLAFPIIVCALLASARLAILVSISYVIIILLVVTAFQIPVFVLDSAIPFILMIGALVVAITRVRQREQSEVEYETEQRIAMQQQMQNRERFYRILLDSFNTGVIIADSEYLMVKDTNTAMMDLLDRDRIEIVGEKVSDIISIPGFSLDESLLTSTSPDVFEGEIVSKNNISTPVIVNFSEIRSEDTTDVFITFIDITEKKETEQREKYLEQELITNSRLASLGQLTAGVAHEINNPLSTILLYTDLLLDSDVPAEFMQDINVINTQVERITKIVSGMLNFANPNRSSGNELDINEVLNETLDLYTHELRLSNIELNKQFTESPLPVIANRTQLQQVFFNIINNAQKEMVEAHGVGQLTVTTETVDDMVRVYLSDTGRGISEENMTRMFEPFYTTKGIGEGTGLGLSICHGIVTSLGGTIWAENVEGGGARFVVELPASSISEEILFRDDLTDLDEFSKDMIKVLIVDDELPMLNAMDRSLSTLGYTVTTAKNSIDARALISSTAFDVILLDVKMPGMTGIEFYYEVEGKNPEMLKNIVFLTGNALDQETHTFFQEKQVPYIRKPVSANNIIKKIQETISRG
jgi:PAS domain S-box-containing protein